MSDLNFGSWIPLISENDALTKKIHQLAENIEQYSNATENAGLMTGLSGVALFFSEYGLFCNEDKTSIIESLIERAFEKVQQKWHPPSFCSGLSGLLWTTRFLIETRGLHLDLDLVEIEEFLLLQEFEHAQKNDFDFLHGANGIFYYFLTSQTGIQEDHLTKYLKLLESFSVGDGIGAIAWESIVDSDDPKLVRNISLSHGMSSTIIILTEALRQFPNNFILRDLLDKAVNFILRCENTKGGLSLFPNYVSATTGQVQASRLGWCYGDLGIGIALSKAVSY